MTLPFTCVFVAFALIYLPRLLVIVAQARDEKGYDNIHPREQQARLVPGWARRANAAHANAFESFAPFAAAVVVAHLAGASPAWSGYLAVTHVVARTVYPLLYVAGLGAPRSLVWLTGLAATGGLFVLPWVAPA